MDDYDDYYDAAKKDGERFIQGKNGGCIDRGERQAKHTPGPWIASRWTSKENGEWIGEGWDILAQGNLLPRSSFDASPDAPDEPEANARLIAAAPKLLKACQALLDRLSAAVCDDNGLWDEYLAADAAVAEALGRA